MKKMKCLWISLTLVLLSGCTLLLIEKSRDADVDDGVDSDADGDGDTDIDGDVDGDGDTDGDLDGDTDSDADKDIDTDIDEDVDRDAEVDRDVEVDADDEVDADAECTPTEETCNATDDDCDGSIDEAGCDCVVEEWGGSVYLFCWSGAGGARETNDARAYCEARGYHLAVIESADEDAWLMDVAFALDDQDWGFDLSDEASDGDWRWYDGSSPGYTNWGADEPNGSTSENCCEFRPSTRAWNDCNCASARPYICEVSA